MGLACIVSVAAAQDISKKDVPSVVLNAVQSRYPHATDLEWEKRGDLYKAEFEVNNRDHELWIDSNGNIQTHREEISKSALPAVVSESIKANFEGYKIDDVDKIEKDGKVFYRVELDGRAGDRNVLFAADGSVVENKKD